jgi:hypothetical protein
MPLDETGAYVPTLQPPTPGQLGVAPAPGVQLPPNLPLDPLADPTGATLNVRPLVQSPTADVPAFAGGGMTAPVVPVAPGAPVVASQATPPVPETPVIPIRRAAHAAGAPGAPAPVPGGGIPGELDALGKQIDTNQQGEAAALTSQGDVEAAGAAQKAEGLAQQADLQRQQAADLAAQQQYVRDRQAELNDVDRANLENANQKVIPDFWSGREGAHVGASIGVVLAGIGAGFLGSTQNQADQVIQHNVDKYYDRKKEEIDNLFKYATAQGLVNDKARDQYAKSITDLLQQHAATLDAAKTRVESVAAESQSDDAKARAAVLASQLGNAAAKEHLQVQDARIKWYDAQDANKAKLMEGRAALINANANAARVGIEKTKAKGEGDEKADEAAFRTYVQGPHGSDAKEIGRRVQALRSAASDIEGARSVGEVTAQIDKAIAADAGQGTRGVSMGQLHTILPNLVSATGEISNKVSQNWDGSAGKEFRAAAKRMILVPLQGRTAEYNQRANDLEKSVALTPHAQKNPAFAKTARAQLYPELPPLETGGAAPVSGPAEGSTATSGGKPIIFKGGKWVPNG